MTEDNTTPQEWFEKWFDSPYYNMLYHHRDEAEAASLISELVSYLSLSPQDTVLDMGCGEGRHSRELHALGLSVTGIDIAPNRIATAQRLSDPDIAYFVHDMRETFRVNYFKAVFNLFTSFGYFQKRRETLEAAHSFVAALIPGGHLIIDYLNVHKAIATIVPEEEVIKGAYRFIISRFVSDHKIVKRIRVVKPDHSHQDFEEKVAAFTLQDFICIFEPLGVKLIKCFGNYQLEEYNPDTSPRLILHFQKK